MSNACAVKVDEIESMKQAFLQNGGKIVVVKGQRRLPKYLRYNSSTVNGKNHAPR